MQSLKRLLLLTALLFLIPSISYAQGQSVTVREVNIDYYLLNYFNRTVPLPRSVGGSAVNQYSLLNFFTPGFYFVSHDLDFLGTEQTVRSTGLGGAGVAVQGGAGAIAVNPAGLGRGANANEVYFGATTRFGSGASQLSDELVFQTGIVGEILPQSTSVEPRFMFNQAGLFISGRPFHGGEDPSAARRALGRLAFAAGYRRFVELSNPTNSITTFLPEGGLAGLSAEVKSAAQSREKGGIDAVSVAFGTSFGSADSPLQLAVGGNANLVSGRMNAEQIFTVSQLTQIVRNLPGDLGRAAILRQKFTGTAFDLGAQLALFDGTLQIGGTFRPAYTLEMRGGRYSTAEADIQSGDPSGILLANGRIADYDMELPRSFRAGGALRLAPLIGDGVDRGGILGYVHRFFGRANVMADLSEMNLSEATVQHLDEMLDNSQLAEDPFFELLNLNLAETFGPDAVLDPVMPLANGDAGLRDKSSIHVGLETPIFDRPGLKLDLRLGYETVPVSFSTLVLDDPVSGPSGDERHVRRNADGTPVLEDIEGTGFSFGLGYTTGLVRFDAAFRSTRYDFVTWWGGAEPLSWYHPVTGTYEPLAPPEQFAAIDASRTDNAFQLSATLGF